MLDHIILWSLRRRAVVLILATLLILFGLHSAYQAQMDVFPEFAPPQVEVRTNAPGYSPEEVESLVTLPVESVLNGTNGLETLRSSSSAGLSNITAIFKTGADLFHARQLVAEQLQLVSSQLPLDANQPQMMPIVASVGILEHVALTADRTSMMDLRTLADWTIRPRLLGTPGIAQVIVWGGQQKQYQVLVDPLKLKDFNLTLSQAVQAAQLSNQSAAAGYAVNNGQIFVIQGEGWVHSVPDLAGAVVAVRNGVPVTLNQVARVQVAPAFKVGDSTLGRQPCVYLTIMKQVGANTLSTSVALDEALNGLRPALPSDIHMTRTFRQADFIQVSIHSILMAILEGTFFILVVLFLFLDNWRTGFISMVAIPLSLLAAILVLQLSGATLNVMTLGGLAVAIGELVDDAIIDVENVYRRLRENRLKPSPEPALAVVFKASSEVRHSIIYASFMVALVFVPVFALQGLAGSIFAPLAEAYVISILASLLVALTVTPALCFLLLPSAAQAAHETRLVGWLKQGYQRLLQHSLMHPMKILAAAAVLLAAALASLPFFGGSFLPEFNEGNLVIRMTALPGTSLDQTLRLAQAAMAQLRKVPEVATVGQRAGRAELDEDAMETNSNEMDVRLQLKHRRQAEVIDDVRRRLARVPGVTFDVSQFISERISEVLAGSTGMISVKIFGPDLAVLREKAAELQSVMAGVPGVVDLEPEPLITVPKVLVRFDHSAMARAGLRSGDLAQLLETALRGKVVSHVFQQQRSFALLVRFDPQAVTPGGSGPAAPASADGYGSEDPGSEEAWTVHNLEQVRQTYIDTPLGGKLPLGSLADVRLVSGPDVINRENAQRRMVVQANVSGVSLKDAVQKIQSEVAKRITLPQGYYVVYGGQFEAEIEAEHQMLLLSLAVLAGIFILLLLAFGSARESLLVMANVPLALLGGVLAVAATGGNVSLGSLVGFIAVLGIVMRNGIMLITHYHHLMWEEGEHFGADLIRRGAMERLTPILMTAGTAGLGLLPLALSAGQPGRELEQPMAVVILGGLVTATLLNMVVIPALYLRFGKPPALESASAH